MQLEIASLLVTGPRGDTASLLLLASPHIIPLSLSLSTEPLVVKWTPTLLELELELESGEK